MPDGSVTHRPDLLDRECSVGSLQFLQADNIRFFALKPSEQDRQSGPNAIDIESGNFEHIAVKLSGLRKT